MSKNKILEEFLKLDNKIINRIKLEEYIDFCIKNDTRKKIKGKTTSHHILPMAKTLPFKKYSNLKQHEWNKSELSYYNHYYAHYLLTQAIDHISILIAFTGMHMRDSKLNRISESELIYPDEFNKIWENRNRKIKEHRLEIIIDDDGNEMTRAALYSKNRKISDDLRMKMSERMSGKNNIANNKEVVSKIRETKQNTYIDGKNLDTISAERAANTMKNEYIGKDGEITTIYKETGKKISKNLLQIEENGKTKAYNRNKQTHEKLRKNGNWYKVLNIFDTSYEKILPAVEVRNISPGLEKCNKENYLGKSKFGQTILTKKGKCDLIGLYVEKLI